MLVRFVGSEPSGFITQMSQVSSPGGELNSQTSKAIWPLTELTWATTVDAEKRTAAVTAARVGFDVRI